MAARTSRGDGGARPLTGGRRVLGCSIAVLVVLILVGGIASAFLVGSGYVPFFSMKTSWEAPYDRGTSDQGNGAWLAGDTVARSRFDGVTGYDVRSGKQRWDYVVPGRADICTVSPDATGTTVLIAYGEKDRCGTAVALDLTGGRELWRKPGAPGADAYAGVVTGGGLAVLLDHGGTVRALDLKTGTPRWKAAVPKGCAPGAVGASAKQIVATVACGDEMKLAAFDPADGKARWTVPLDERRGVPATMKASVLSADPAVVFLAEDGGEERVATLSFGPEGRPLAHVEGVGDYGSIEEVRVGGDRLFAIASYEGSQSTWERVVAFDLATGDQVWRSDIGKADLDGLDVRDGRVTTVDLDKKYGDSLYVFDAATGDEEDDRSFRDRVGKGYTGGLDDLFTFEERAVAVRWGAGERPVSVYERW
ncbi:PQQ-binding-like beta-propeller repeat protein [Streptomyces sp. NPDC127132]|uniref:outer membrane protein assembly factor BamB family protein n=1 Tax=Streptomyces sp. NPDC127132 TaxID=3345374 RepID=UPI00363520D0